MMRLQRGARAALLLAMSGALPACNEGERAEPPPITLNEEQAVADAAEMLEERVPEQDSADANGAEQAPQDSNE